MMNEKFAFIFLWFLVNILVIPSIHSQTGYSYPGHQPYNVSYTSTYLPKVYDVIISEIMADPTPQVLLPDAEYIELFNRSSMPIDLDGWKILFGNNAKILPLFTLDPGCYVILCDEKDTALFAVYGKIIPITSMPAILNSGQTLTLKDLSGQVMHSVGFTPGWFASDYKAEGGWSLEIVDPDNPCGKSGNWHESEDYRGGTPGTVNSVNADNPDKERPQLWRATMVSENDVDLHFNEDLDSSSAADPFLYSVSSGILNPAKAIPISPDYSNILLQFPQPFEFNRIYSVSILGSIKDCAGNILESNSIAEFGIPAIADSFDLIINEILFDATQDGAEFIELYNRSQKILDLSAFSLALTDPYTGNILKLTSFKDLPFLLLPDSYVAITNNLSKLQNKYYTPNPGSLVEMETLFNFPDESGNIKLLNEHLSCIDEFHYSSDMQFDLLSSAEGVSLERINPDAATEDINNWHSAAETVGFATPGYSNSQQQSNEDSYVTLSVMPEVISPDNDGYNDYATLYYHFDDAGRIANIIIYNPQGKRIKTIAANVMLGTEGFFTWDGTTGTGEPVPVGIYLFYIETQNSRGKVSRFKKICTVAKKIN